MKKFLVLALVAMISATGFSKTIDEVFNSFPKADNVQEVTLDKAMMSMAMAAGANQAKQIKDIDANFLKLMKCLFFNFDTCKTK